MWRPFDIYLPISDGNPPKYCETILVEVYENFGEEFLTKESLDRIEEVTQRYLNGNL